jgi:23S rRNA (uracil1939-C5)-methyltransferase
MSSGAAERATPDLKSSLHIDDLLANGQGVARDKGLVVFVTGALPGEDVHVAVDAVKRTYVSAHATSIVTPSPDRIASPCPVFPRCGGCQTLHFKYSAQLRWKQQMVRDALERLAGLTDVHVVETVASDFLEQTRYRNKATLVCKVAGHRAAIGFYAARSHHIVPITHCPVLLPWLDDAVRELSRLVEKMPALLHGVRHIVVRTGLSRESLVLGLSMAGPRPELASFVPTLRARLPNLTGIMASWDPPNANAVFGRRVATLWGTPVTTERVAGLMFSFGIASFFQINTAMLEKICASILDALTNAARIVDLYCGVGTFAILSGKRGVISTGVESVREAVEEAAANAARNGVTNAAFECATAVEAVEGTRGRTLLSGADAVIVDPPRRGCEPEVLDSLGRARVPRILYLSCNPATLARDARRLVDCGYQMRSAAPFDMFPFTGHVEVLADFFLPSAE